MQRAFLVVLSREAEKWGPIIMVLPGEIVKADLGPAAHTECEGFTQEALENQAGLDFHLCPNQKVTLPHMGITYNMATHLFWQQMC